MTKGARILSQLELFIPDVRTISPLWLVSNVDWTVMENSDENGVDFCALKVYFSMF